MSNAPRSPFAETERLLAIWRRHQRAAVIAGGGNPIIVDNELDELVAEVLRGLWYGRARTWSRLGATPEERANSPDVTRAEIDAVLDSMASPEFPLGSAAGRFEYIDDEDDEDGERVVWSMEVHDAEGHATVCMKEGNMTSPCDAVVLTDEGVTGEFDEAPSHIVNLWNAWRAARTGKN